MDESKKMAFSRHFRMAKQVPSHVLILGVALAFCFIFSIWLLSPPTEVVPEEVPSNTVPENFKSDSPVVTDSTIEPQNTDEVKTEETTTVNSESITSNEEQKVLENESENSTTNEEPKDDRTSDETPQSNVSVEKLKTQEEKKETSSANQNEGFAETTAAESELVTENVEKPKNWSTQAVESTEEKKEISENQQTEVDDENINSGSETPMGSVETETETSTEQGSQGTLLYDWKTCQWQGAMDYIPCLDNQEAIKRLPSTRRFQHRERHCPSADQFPMCLLPLPKGYKVPIKWARSRDEIWFDNVPHTKLVSYKKDQNWVKLAGDKLVFPGGGTQFKFGASKYIESIEEYVPDVAWGRHTRIVLDIGAGVASFGGFLFDRDVVTMSFAPKDEHEAQIQLALERGIPAMSAVMGTQRLPFPSNSYDLAHCARCRIHWHGDGGKWLVEVNRVLRPGGYFVWSATPVYRNIPEDRAFWRAMEDLRKAMCWKLVVKAKGLTSGVGVAVYQKPTLNTCYDNRGVDDPPMCTETDNPDAAWYTPLESCMQKVPTDENVHGTSWPPVWPERLDATPTWLKGSQKTLYGRPADIEMQEDSEHWKRIVTNSYLKGIGIDWEGIRNVMDMKAGYGGFAAALLRTKAWVLNVVPIDEPDTLPVIFDRGLLGIYHDWCESFSTYPRTYDLLHADHVFKRLTSRCKPVYTLLEMDRILRPQGWMIFRETTEILNQIRPIIQSLHWTVHLTYVEGQEELMVVQKTFWRPEPQDPEGK